MKKSLIYILILLIFSGILFGLYYNIRKKNTSDIYNQKAIINQTSFFISKLLVNTEIDTNSLRNKLGDNYKIEQINKKCIIVFPKDFNVKDFYGFEINIDELKRVQYVGLYKP